ncbi:MAG TPA: 3-oxoadipate enol-lactonase [Dongiaceae bacterium]|nr:3-oxoadipate enol-lactonase [Dongiaceae bacterium]
MSSDGAENRPAVLMSNSLAADLTMWDSQAKALSQDFRVIRYDTRGHGQTEATAGDYSLDLLVDDVLALLDTLKIPTVHFIGLSLGGMIGQLLGARAPDRLRSLTLCATFAQTSPDLWKQRIATVKQHGLEPVVEPTLERWFTPYFRERHGDVVNAARAMIRLTSAEGYIGCAAAIRDMNLAGVAEKIATPTLLIAGAEDPSATPDMMLGLHKRISGSKFALLPDAAHVLTMEQPQAITEIISSFLARQS